MNSIEDYIYTRMLPLNNQEIKSSCLRMEEFIKTNIHEKEGFNAYSNADGTTSPSTLSLNYGYNLFLYPQPGFHDLFKMIRDSFQFIKRRKGISYNNFYMKCWLNVFEYGNKIDWHKHYPVEARAWHGFYCVHSGDSRTTYKFPNNKIVEVPSKDGLLVISQSGDELHKTSDWTDKDNKRITIAFDIVPDVVASQKMMVWFPL